MAARQARGQGQQVLFHDLVFQRAAGAFAFNDHRVKFVELKNFGKIVQLPGKGHQRKARQLFVFKHIVVKGGQELPAFNQRVILVFLVGFDQAEADVHRVQKLLEFRQSADGDRGGKFGGVLPGQAVFAENFLPFNHPHAPSEIFLSI